MKPTNLILSLLVALSVLGFVQQTEARRVVHRRAVGVLYYSAGGTGRGEFYLQTGGRILQLTFYKPTSYIERGFKGGFGDGDGYDYGAIWQITYHVNKDKELILDSATYTGRFDQAVRTADNLIRHHFELLARHDYESAYKNLSPSLRSRQSFEEFVKSFRDKKFSEYVPSFANTIIKHNPTEVVVLVDRDQFVGGKSGDYRFVIRRNNGNWYIDEITPISQEEWLKYHL
ncbi:MAG: hypothetical protein ACJ74W_00900 [Pyrinomonadaceae bacterium]